MRYLYLATLLSLAVNMAAAKPDFSGTWKLNAAKSEFGAAPAPQAMTRVVKHSDPALNITTTQTGGAGATFTTELKYTTDGKEFTNQTRQGEVKGTARWNGAALVVEYKINSPQAGELSIQDRWKLSEDGKATIIESTIQGGFGTFERRMVFDKE